MTDMKQPGTVTKAGQRLVCFQHGEDKLVDQINEYAEKYDLEIERLDYMQDAKPRVAYVLFRKRPFGLCAECNGECPEQDYLCSRCRT